MHVTQRVAGLRPASANSRTRRALAACLSVPLLASCGAASSTDEESRSGGETFTLSLATPFAPADMMQVEVYEPLVESIREETDGAIDIEIYPGGSLSSGDRIYDDVVSGAVDMGYTVAAFMPGRFPLTEAFELPFLWESAEQGTEALWLAREEFPEFQEEYSDVKLLAMWLHEPAQMWFSEEEVSSLGQLSGLTVRAPGTIQTNLVSALGASPVSMSPPELFDALDRNVIDGVMVGATGVDIFGLYEPINHVTRGDFYAATQLLVMNRDLWDRMSADQRKAIEQLVGRQLSLKSAQLYDRRAEEIMDSLVEQEIAVHELDGDERRRWHEAGEPVIEDWVQRRSADGLPAERFYEALRNHSDS
jgi:TRAP-type C4-dicarboxylate transport system substrate-binding protein